MKIGFAKYIITIYLHCDPTASHYIKVIMDGIFGYENFMNEIVWCYKSRPQPKKNFGKNMIQYFFIQKQKIIVFFGKR